MSQLLEDLVWLREFLTPDTWTRGGLAYYDHNLSTRDGLTPDDPAAKCFCIGGAVIKRIPITDAERKLFDAMDILTDNPSFTDLYIAIIYSPIPWLEPRRRDIIHALEIISSLDQDSDRFARWRRNEQYKKFSDEDLYALMDFQKLWIWNDNNSLETIHVGLDRAINAEKAKVNT